MTKFRENLHTHKTIAWSIVLAYVVFLGCFAFPLSSREVPFDYSKAVIVSVGYGILGMYFAGLLEKHKSRIVLVLTAGLSVIGLLCRYALEYGEVSNTMNFTAQNIATFLVAMPLYCTVVYWCIYRFEGKHG